MTVLERRAMGIWLLTAVLIFSLVGCSTDTPVGSVDSTTLAPISSATHMSPPPEGSVQFVADVATIDLDQRMLTFVDRDETVIAAEDCEIVEIVAGVETDMVFGDIEVAMHLKVCGILQDDGTVLAHKLCVYTGSECYTYDLAFRDTIISIDYAAGSFTTANRTEIILTDETTRIWGVEPEPEQNQEPANGSTGHGATDAGSNDGRYAPMQVAYEFADLQIGNCLEIKANIVDENTLQATSIKIANSVYRQYIEFESTLANVDYEGRTVTFDDNEWLGSVCLGAELLNASAEAITFEDFVSGELVFVKGFPTEDNNLKICVMSSKVE